MSTTRIPKEPPLRLRDLRPPRAGTGRTFPFSAPNRSYFAFARNALHALLAALGVGPDDEVLLPSFHCVSLVEPVVRSGARCRFYPVNLRFETDPARLEADFSPRTRALVVVHFFGFPQPTGRLRALCDARGVLLIEDCCHALFSCAGERPLGGDGHVALFSLRKTLPVADGALLASSDGDRRLPGPFAGPGWRYEMRICRSTAARAVRRRFPLDPGTGEPADAPAASGIAPRQDGDGTTPDGWLFGYDLNPDLSARRGSAASRWIARRLDPHPVRSRRRANYLRLLERLRGKGPVRPALGDLPEGVCPWTFPLDAGGVPSLDRRLRRLGVPAFTFGEVLHSALPRGMFPEAEYLALNLVQLPVHQGMTPAQLDSVAEAVHEVAGAS